MDAGFGKNLCGRIANRTWLGKGNDDDRYTDRVLVSFCQPRKFE